MQCEWLTNCHSLVWVKLLKTANPLFCKCRCLYANVLINEVTVSELVFFQLSVSLIFFMLVYGTSESCFPCRKHYFPRLSSFLQQ